MSSRDTAVPDITLYTNHGCPWAGRAQATLDELGLPYKEVIMDLDAPRPDWYLEDVNPRGLVPALKYSNGDGINETFVESGVIVRFLIEAHPGKLFPQSSGPATALKLARINFFAETYFGKVQPHFIPLVKAATPQIQQEKAQEMLAAIERELEPRLADANPFFGGSQELTLAEINVGPFVLRLLEFTDDIIFPKSMGVAMRALPNFSRWAEACISHKTIVAHWKSDIDIQRVEDRLWVMIPSERKPVVA